MANEDYKYKKTIYTDLSSLSGTNNTVFTGVDDLVNLNFDPYVNGYAFIYWVSLPSWFEKDQDLKKFKQMTQKNFKSFQGISDIQLNTVQLQTGFAGHNFDVVGDVNRDNTDFTISHKEYSGGIMRKMYQKWITMMRDPRTGTALYPKLYGVDYGAKNHTGQLLYIVTRPDVTNSGKHNVEFAIFYSNVFPTNVPLGTLYPFELGQQDSPSVDIQFKGFPEIGPDVEDWAQKILNEKIMSPSGDSYIPEADNYHTNPDANAVFSQGTGTLADILGAGTDSTTGS